MLQCHKFYNCTNVHKIHIPSRWHARPWCRHSSTRLLELHASSITESQSSNTPTNEVSESPPNIIRYGIAAEQGPRDTMEDVTEVIEKGKCGFLFASMSFSTTQHTLNSRVSAHSTDKAIFVNKFITFAAVFDGHAGDAAARYLKTHLYKVFSEKVDMHSLGLDCTLDQREEGLCCPVELHSVLSQSYKQADTNLLQWLEQQDEEDACSGCTATTVLIRSDRIIVANVGDSRAVLCRTGRAVNLSTEHRVYGQGQIVESETLRIENSGGWVDDGRVCGILAVSRAFGDADFKGEGLERLLIRGVEDDMWSADFAASVQFTADPVIAEPDVYQMSVVEESDEFLIVATDGLWDVVSSEEAVKFARSDLMKGKSPQEAAERLTMVALRRYTADNVAVVVIDMLGADKWSAVVGAEKKQKLFGFF